MLNVTLDKINSIVTLEPEGILKKDDFDAAVKIIDPYIEENGKLNGLIIETESFPGWKSFSAMLSHLRFVKDHHRKIAFVAIATDSAFRGFAEHAATHFVSAQIKTFSYSELDQAKEWINENVSI